MKPIQFVAGIAAASLLAGPLSGVASASAVTTGASRGHLTATQFEALRAKNLPFAGWARPTQPVDIAVHLPLRNVAKAQALAAQLSNPKSANYHKWLTRAQFDAQFGPLASDKNSVAATLRAAGFTVKKIESQVVHATAPAATVSSFFGTRLGLVRDGNVLKVDARTSYTVPSALSKLGVQVLGLRAMPHAHYLHEVSLRKLPIARFHAASASKPKPNAFYGQLGPYFPAELYQAYGQPSQTFVNGTGETIGIVGASDSTDAENQVLWCTYGLGPNCGLSGGTLAPYPVVNHIDFPGYIPPDTDGNSIEAALDAQLAGGSAPGAVIDQYGANAGSGYPFVDAYSYIVSQDVDDVITTSYSVGCDPDYITGGLPALGYLVTLDQLFLQGNVQGQTFLFSSGDHGAYGCADEGDTTDLSPSTVASDPNVTAVGGTTALNTTFLDNGYGTGYASESSYSAPGFSEGGWGSGGGVSSIFQTPFFQSAIGLDPGTPNTVLGAPFGTGRQSPDVALHMGGPGDYFGDYGPFSEDFFYISPYGDYLGIVIGTSASSPELAGWIAQILSAANAAEGGAVGPRLGSANELFYALQYYGYGLEAFNQYIPGDNGYTYYRPTTYAGAGYNQVIGLGTPNTSVILNIVGAGGPFVAAGDTYTASNP